MSVWLVVALVFAAAMWMLSPVIAGMMDTGDYGKAQKVFLGLAVAAALVTLVVVMKSKRPKPVTFRTSGGRYRVQRITQLVIILLLPAAAWADNGFFGTPPSAFKGMIIPELYGFGDSTAVRILVDEKRLVEIWQYAEGADATIFGKIWKNNKGLTDNRVLYFFELTLTKKGGPARTAFLMVWKREALIMPEYSGEPDDDQTKFVMKVMEALQGPSALAERR